MTEFISRNYGNEGYEIIIKTDSYEHYRATEDFARRLIDHSKPMRNADKIRAMSDEELARWLVYVRADVRTTRYASIGEPAVRANIEWLLQPAEEEVDNG